MSAPAAGGARDQLARLLTLVPYLHSRAEVRVEDAAQVLGVEPAQVLKDLKVLLMCGLPGGYPDDLIDVDLDALEEPDSDGVIRVSNADYLARPLRLSPTEATALIVALRAVRESADEATRDVVERTLRKLESAAAEGALHDHVDVEVGQEEAEGFRRALNDAVASRRQVRMTYWVPTRDEARTRLVDPLRVFAAQGFDYLEAWCHDATDLRIFRIDRIQDLDVLDSPVDEHDVTPAELPDELFRSGEHLTLATLALAPGAHWVPDYYPVVAVRHGAEGRMEVDLRIADERWLRRLLLRLAPDAEVLAPAELADAQRDDAWKVLGLYG